MKKRRFMTAQEAAQTLDISVTTLYAYVSRGLIRAEALDRGQRTKQYLAEDIEKLKARKEQRRNPAKVAESALHWGTPILETAITLITDDRFFYRGHDAIRLAKTNSVEQVATLIWTGILPKGAAPLFTRTNGRLSGRCQAVRPHLADLPPLEAFQTLLPLAAADDLAAYNLRSESVIQTGAHILSLLTAIAAGTDIVAEGIAATLQQSWVPHDPQAATLIQTALILCADHELNVSSFAGRCVASARSNPYQVVIAGIAALQGTRHGRVTDRFSALLREVGDPKQAKTIVVDRLKRGEGIPGFGQPLYPNGDPRGRLLVDLVAQAYPGSEVVALVTAIQAAVYEVLEEYLTLDVGLTTVAKVLNLPPGGAIALFALGRTIGWVGQALETYEADRLIRPRARYVGERPMA